MTIWWRFKIVVFPKSTICFEAFHGRFVSPSTLLLLGGGGDETGKNIEATETSRKDYALTKLMEIMRNKIFWISDRGQDPGR